MIYPELYLGLNYNEKIIFAIAMIVAVYICLIRTRMKNKTQKRKTRQVIYVKQQNENYVRLFANMKEEYLGQRKNILTELNRR